MNGFLADVQIGEQRAFHQRFELAIANCFNLWWREIGLQKKEQNQGDEEISDGEFLLPFVHNSAFALGYLFCRSSTSPKCRQWGPYAMPTDW